MLGYDVDVSCSNYTTTLPQVLDSSGYRTSAIGKDHFGFDYDGDDSPILQGYEDAMIYDAENGERNDDDYYKFWKEKHQDQPTIASDSPEEYNIDYNTWRATDYVASEDENDHPTAWTGNAAVDYIKDFDFDGSESMFLKASFHRPHSPYDPPKRLHDKYKNRLEEMPPRSLSPEGGWDSTNRNRTEMPDDAWSGDPGDVEARKSRAGYFGSIEFVDENVGKIISALEDRGVLDDIWIIWTSDHGDMQGDHYLWRKGFAYEGSTHVPLVISWPRTITSGFLSRGVVIPGLVEMRYIAPTIWDVAGVLDRVKEADPLVTGFSLLPLLRGETFRLRDYIDLEHNFVFQLKFHWNGFVSDDNMKYVYNAQTGSEQLFNLTSDVFELNDISDTNADLIAVWRSRLVDQF
ncbi:hypothetical protein TrVE_jg10620 [Triparma verrucosa]|uniref:Sulfatase N-terminal domain-containing protein n=1 Tax=Triparma verrucosa TaxID=1606542 RepID=A0A9W7CDR9_9STRA|nr:hypothetical protein TrVE_jg10620 [Triparma verrucosa]